MGRGTLANYLGGPRVLMVLGFDPFFNVYTLKMRLRRCGAHRFKSLAFTTSPDHLQSLSRSS